MNNISYLITPTALHLTLIDDGKVVQETIQKTDNKYVILLDYIKDKSKTVSDYLSVLMPKDIVVEIDGFTVNGNEVSHEAVGKLHSTLAKKVKDMVNEQIPLTPIYNFIKNLYNNPSATSIAELMDFMDHKHLSITEDGYLLAYKGVRKDAYSITGNTDTTVLQGNVDSQGRIYNGVGETIEVRRSDVDDNRKAGCSFGLHVGSFEYADDFAYYYDMDNNTSGNRGLFCLIKVNPADVVSVPEHCSFKKCRVSKYLVLQHIEPKPLNSITCTEDAEEIHGEYETIRERQAELENTVSDSIDYFTSWDSETVSYSSVKEDVEEELLRPVDYLSFQTALQSLGYRWSETADEIYL